jgi:carboxyl-terminal processing protease
MKITKQMLSATLALAPFLVGGHQQQPISNHSIPISNLRGRNVQEESTLCDEIFGSFLTAGIWTSRGYGWTIEVQEDDTCRVFEESEISCIPNTSLGNGYKVLSINMIGHLAAIDIDQQADVIFEKTDTFQHGCANGVTPVLGDEDYERKALDIFDIFDQVFQEHYAFFELRGVDWGLLTETARSTLVANSTDEELWDAMVSCIAPLEDYHVGLSSPDGNEFRSKGLPIFDQMFEEYLGQDEIEDPEMYIGSQVQAWFGILASYMDPGSFDGIPMEYSYGTAKNGTVAYLQLNNFEFGDDVFVLIESLLSDGGMFAGASSLILDVRANGGGKDSAALRLASYFATEEATIAFIKRTKNRDEYTPESEVFILKSPEEIHFKGDKVVLLFSDSCGSACETFSLAMKQLPVVEAIGRDTLGALSYIFGRSFPNGWGVGLSNEEYRSPQGDLYEGTGVPPDIMTEAGLLPLEERQAGVDTWMELALDLASEKDNATPAPTTPDQSDDGSSASGLNAVVWLAALLTSATFFVLQN